MWLKGAAAAALLCGAAAQTDECLLAATEQACAALPLPCTWRGTCFTRYPAVGQGDCVDAAGAALPYYVSQSDGFSTAAGQCAAFCDALAQCVGYRVRATAATGQCVLYVDASVAGAAGDSPGAGFSYVVAGGTAPIAAGGGAPVAETPAAAAEWLCRVRRCDGSDCGCATCGTPSGVRGACSCSRTMTATATLLSSTATATVSDSGSLSVTGSSSASPTLSATGAATATATATASGTPQVYDECGAMRCGVGQTCADPVPTSAALGDYVCSCENGAGTAVGRPVERCTDDECGAAPCPRGQTCADPNPSSASLGDFVCTCVNSAALSAVGRGVGSCAVLVLDECSPSPCLEGQTCTDADTSADSRDDFVCACDNGGPAKVGGAAPVCVYDECSGRRCGGQQCSDANTASDSLGDFVCRCAANGLEATGSTVDAALCPPVPTATPTLTPAPQPPLAEPWAPGDVARVTVNATFARAAAAGSGILFEDRMEQQLGRAGTVTVVDAAGNVQLRFADGSLSWWAPAVLSALAAPSEQTGAPAAAADDDDDDEAAFSFLVAAVAVCLLLMLCYAGARVAPEELAPEVGPAAAATAAAAAITAVSAAAAADRARTPAPYSPPPVDPSPPAPAPAPAPPPPPQLPISPPLPAPRPDVAAVWAAADLQAVVTEPLLVYVPPASAIRVADDTPAQEQWDAGSSSGLPRAGSVTQSPARHAGPSPARPAAQRSPARAAHSLRGAAHRFRASRGTVHRPTPLSAPYATPARAGAPSSRLPPPSFSSPAPAARGDYSALVDLLPPLPS